MDDETQHHQSTGTRGSATSTATGEVVVVAGGLAPRPEVARHLSPDAIVVAADSGWDCARAIGLLPSVLVGDLDSISPEGLDEARRTGAAIERHAPDKDATDTELALACAATMARRLVLVAGGDRLDHLLGALGVLADPRWHRLPIRGFVGSARLHRVGPTEGLTLSVRTGATISLLALGGAAEAVHTDGLTWPLVGESLEPWQSRGMSNVAATDTVRVSLGSGSLLVLEPGFLDEPEVRP